MQRCYDPRSFPQGSVMQQAFIDNNRAWHRSELQELFSVLLFVFLKRDLVGRDIEVAPGLATQVRNFPVEMWYTVFGFLMHNETPQSLDFGGAAIPPKCGKDAYRLALGV